jgi:hypothetical protein
MGMLWPLEMKRLSFYRKRTQARQAPSWLATCCDGLCLLLLEELNMNVQDPRPKKGRYSVQLMSEAVCFKCHGL